VNWLGFTLARLFAFQKVECDENPPYILTYSVALLSQSEGT